MQILVRNDLTLGSFGRTSVLVVKPTDTIYNIMAKMEDIMGVPPIQQRMIVNCKTLYDDTPGTLADHKIEESMTLHALYCFSGTIRLQKKTLKALGIAIVDDDDDDYSEDDDDD
ncbi:unnamed protein product [Urochloa humidicola]